MSTKAMQVSNFVEYRINSLANSNYESGVKATLAHLRRGVGKHPAANLVYGKQHLVAFHRICRGLVQNQVMANLRCMLH